MKLLNGTVFLASAVLALGACSPTPAPPTSAADTPHSVEAFYQDAELSARTIEACRALNEADRRAKAEKPACQNVWASEKRHSTESDEKSTEAWNSWMQGELERKRAARAADGAAKSPPTEHK